jgi:uncharacterized protein (TIGR03437 family)
MKFRWILWLVATVALGQGTGRTDATFGTVVGPTTSGGVNFLVGGVSDLVLDEARGRLYLINSGQRRVEIYSVPQRRFLNAVQTDLLPLSAALSRSGKFLYVTCHEGGALNVIDLDLQSLVRRVSLPAKPEGVAVGYDEKVLLTTIGTGTNNTANTLLVFDPSPEASANPIGNVTFTPPTPTPPVLPPPVGRVAFAPRTNLIATRDGTRIIGHISTGAATANQRAVFAYDVVSSSLLGSRIVTLETSTVLSVAPDGSKFMAGLRLFDSETLQVLAQQNAANLPYTLPTGSNFNIQQNQGGSVFSPDGSRLYSAFNFAPLSNPPARANISQLLVNDPDNLLVSMGFKLPENLSGNMVISSDGGTIYALSESGFVILPLNQVQNNPLAVPDSTAALLAIDQCGAVAALKKASVAVTNAGRGRFTASAQLVPTIGAAGTIPPIVGPGGIGAGGTGPGGGQPGGGIVIVLPPGVTVPGANLNQQQQAIAGTAPSVQNQQTADGANITFTFNAVNGRAPGTIAPHDFQIYAPEAINLPPQVRIYQNTRDTEARADVQVMPSGVSGNEGLFDIVHDTIRQRLYLANSGLNRVDVYDIRRKSFLAPIKVGQLPHSLALTPEGNTLYVANSGGESISIIDPDKLRVVGRVKFPPLAFNSAAGVLNPSVIAATQRGLQIVMSNGSLWRVVGEEAVPRPASPALGTTTIPAPRTIASSPNGEFAILLGGNGTVYLYDALADDFVQSRQVISAPIQGFFGPVAAGPRGQYFVVNGVVLNQALSILNPVTSGSRPIPALSAVSATTYARFTQPIIQNSNSLATSPPQVELVDAATGQARSVAASALEGPLSTQVGTARVNVNGRTMVVDPQDNTAYILTASGLSIVPLDTPSLTDRPAISANGAVNAASYKTDNTPGGIVSIFGRNLGRTESASSTPLPGNLGGVCVTLNNQALPLFATSAGQINAQIPPELAVGSYPLIVRSLENKVSSVTQTLRLQRYAPAVMVDPASSQAFIYHADGTRVTPDSPTHRDDRLVIYALGLGPTKGPKLTAGQPAPLSPLAEIDSCKVYLGDPRYREAEMDVEWCGLAPGYVGLYQINVYVPWYVIRGDKVPVTITVGGVSSPSSGPVLPYLPVR